MGRPSAWTKARVNLSNAHAAGWGQSDRPPPLGGFPAKPQHSPCFFAAKGRKVRRDLSEPTSRQSAAYARLWRARMDVSGIDRSWLRPSGLKTASWRPTLLRSTAFRAIRRGKRCSGPRAEGRRPSRQPRKAERGRRRTSGPNGSVVDLLSFRGTNPGRPSRVRITRPPGGGNGRPRRHGQNTTPGAPRR